MKDRILNAAQEIAQRKGYDGFSFRDIAAAVGIKPASIHYHFPSKGELTVALVARYTDRLMASLGEPTATAMKTTGDLIDRYIARFRGTLEHDGRMCLAGIFATEIDTLPAEVHEEIERFVLANIEWLTSALRQYGSRRVRASHQTDRARAIFSALEGAMLVARGTHNISAFDTIVSSYRSAGLLPAQGKPN